jgi:hypothetical protein
MKLEEGWESRSYTDKHTFYIKLKNRIEAMVEERRQT